MAILAADAIGNGRFFVPDEEGAPAAWIAQWRELVHPRISEYRGRIDRMTGHPPLVEFKSAMAAVRCAIAVQRTMLRRIGVGPVERIGVGPVERLEFRVGINAGDVIADGPDMWGIAVNVAMRLAALAKPGGICVSGRVRDELGDKLDVSFADKGERKLKNIARPVRVFSILI
ncbi:MAG: adenylate/guanylate cyclase domain-containing protein [Tardiphaga sp.]